MNGHMSKPLRAKIEELEAELRERGALIKELRADLTEANDLVDDAREQIEDSNAVIENWIEVFDMAQDENGSWAFDPNQTALWERHAKLHTDHVKLVRQWNKFVARYNGTIAPRYTGRPLHASPAQVIEVRRLRKEGTSLRAIAGRTALTLRTVRTILDQGTGKERSRTNELRRIQNDALGTADFRAHHRGRSHLEKRIGITLKRGADLVKAAKGLGKIKLS